MKLDPVYLVAPSSAPSMPTRRAFLIAGTTFTLGTAVGGACGYSIGAARSTDAAPAEQDLPPSGDVELDELRRLAVKAPIEELVEKRNNFLASLSRDYRNDEVLWRGVERLTARVIADNSFPQRRVSALFLAQVIQFAEPRFHEKYASVEKELRTIR